MNYKKAVARRNRVKGPWAFAKGNSNAKYVRTVRELKNNANAAELLKLA
jgi:hypothetical protein